MSNPRRIILVYAALGLITLILYWPVLRCDFICYDDSDYVTANRQVQSGLTSSGVAWAFTTSHAGNWHPLTWLSHMLDCEMYGLKPGGHHLTNLLIHAASTLLLFGLMRRMTGETWRSAFVAAVFGWHPLHVESVAWIAERKDVLSGLCWILAMTAYGRYVEKTKVPGGRPWGWYALALLSFVLGLMSKPMIVTLPFVLLLLDYWPLERLALARSTGPPQRLRSVAALVFEKLPFFCLSIVSCIVTYKAQQSWGAVHTDELPASLRLENALLAYSRYIAKIFWPVHLAVIYPYDQSPPVLGAIAAGLLMVAMLAGAGVLARRQPYLLTGSLWFAGTLVPVLGLIQVGAQPIADRYTYIPSIGVSIVAAWGLPALLARWSRGNLVVAVAVVLGLAGCLLTTSRQLRHWQNSEALFRHAIEVTEDNYIAEGNLGLALSEEDKLAEAMIHFRRVLRLDPEDIEARNNMAILLEKQGDVAGALKEYAGILGGDPQNQRRATGKAHYNYGVTLMRLGRLAEAETQFETALASKFPVEAAGASLAQIQAGRSRGAQRIQLYRESLRLAPDAPETLNNLAWTLATDPDPALRNGTEAMRLARRACELTKNEQPQLLGTLAAACAEAGDFEQAVATASRARDLAAARNLPEIAARNEELLKLYRNRQAYHEAADATGK